MGYLSELTSNWRPLLAATIGMGSGMSIAGVVTSTIAPSLVEDAGWSKAAFAAVGSAAILMALIFPFVGRLADLIGVRWTALIGQTTLPLVYFAYSLWGNDFTIYVIIFALQSLICVTTTATVYTRLPVQYVQNARGLALAIVASGPAITGVIMTPLLNSYVEAEGWRAAYQALAIFSIIAGALTFLLIPAEASRSVLSGPKRRARDDYPQIFRSRAFLLLLGAMLLCNLPQTILLVQLKMLLLDNGVTGQGATVMLVAAPIGMFAGRFLTGLALDRYAPNVVSFITLSLPSLGLFVLASAFDAPMVLTAAVFCIGFAFGAEGDIVGFMVARHFPVAIYSSVMGLLTAAMSISTASGALLLSLILGQTGGFELFLVIVGVAVLAGASMLLALRDGPPLADPLAAPAH